MDALLKNNKQQILNLFTAISGHSTSLTNLNMWWDKVALVGKINAMNVPQSLLTNMLETKAEFGVLQEDLIEALLSENMLQCGVKNQSIAQTLIDIPVRNLFERTADIGFLATDSDIIDFVDETDINKPDPGSIKRRLQEYAAKYSVYDDIMLFDQHGELILQMSEHAGAAGHDPVIYQVLSEERDYWEICRYSPLRPEHSLSSLFLTRIIAPHSQRVLGVLCLSFRLEGEMAQLFRDLDDRSGIIMALLDNKGGALVSSNTRLLPKGRKLNVQQENQIIRVGEKEYFAAIAGTRSYQGYSGLGWYGCVLLPFTQVAAQPENSIDVGDDARRWQGRSPVLSSIQYRAKIVTEDLDLVVLNGRIAAARRDADEFIPILEEIRQIGRQMQSIFTGSVSQLMTTALKTHYNGMIFQAALAIDIMDRNLYERANDCRWWALTSSFQGMEKEEINGQKQQELMTQVLHYINSLYTVYTGLFVYDRKGKMLATSDTALQPKVGQPVNPETNWKQVLQLKSTQQYCVSSFIPSEYYGGKSTYIYHAAIRQQDNVIGGIGLVFDSEPQFCQMLADALSGSAENRFALYLDREGRVISVSKTEQWLPGDSIELPASLLNAPCGAKGAEIHSISGDEYLLAYSVSKGYREYKTGDGYKNDVIAVIGELNL